MSDTVKIYLANAAQSRDTPKPAEGQQHQPKWCSIWRRHRMPPRAAPAAEDGDGQRAR